MDNFPKANFNSGFKTKDSEMSDDSDPKKKIEVFAHYIRCSEYVVHKSISILYIV